MANTISFIAIPEGKTVRSKECVTGVLVCMPSRTMLTLDQPIGNSNEVVFNIDTQKINSYGNFIGSFIRRLDAQERFATVRVGDKDFPIIREDEAAGMKTISVVRLAGKSYRTQQKTVSIETIDGNTIEIAIDDLSQVKIEKAVLPKDGVYVKNPAVNYLYHQLGLDANVKWPTDKVIRAVKKARRHYRDTTMPEGFLVLEKDYCAFQLRECGRDNVINIPFAMVEEAEKATDTILYKVR